MKKRFGWFTLVCALLMAFPLACSAQGDCLTVAELRENAPDRWQQTYSTQWRTVAIDADIRLPAVDKFPVLLLGGGMKQPDLAAEENGWDSMRLRGDYELICSQKGTEYPKSVNGVRLNRDLQAEGSWRDGFAPQNRYVPMSDITFGEISEMIRTELERFGCDPTAYELTHPERVWAQHMYQYGRKKDMLPGEMFMECLTNVQGIPILGHILTAVQDPRGEGGDYGELSFKPRLSACYNGYAGRLTSLFISKTEVRQTLAADVPLCPVSQVIAALEPEIEAGHIRKIYELRLGYVLFNQPGAYRTKGLTAKQAGAESHAAEYYAKPMWQVSCLWVDSPRGKLRETADYTDDERNSLDHRLLMVDAQTGELVQFSTAKDRCAFKGFLSWEDVNQ